MTGSLDNKLPPNKCDEVRQVHSTKNSGPSTRKPEHYGHVMYDQGRTNHAVLSERTTWIETRRNNTATHIDASAGRHALPGQASAVLGSDGPNTITRGQIRSPTSGQPQRTSQQHVVRLVRVALLGEANPIHCNRLRQSHNGEFQHQCGHECLMRMPRSLALKLRSCNC